MDDRDVKRSLRKRFLAARRAISPRDITRYSERIAMTALTLPAIREARRVMAYASMPDEVATDGIIRVLFDAGKEVALPFITGRRTMEAALLSSPEDMEPGDYGIMTAKNAREKIVAPGTLDLILVPGVAFCLDGRRLGMGGGYYDAFLPRTDAIRVALAFSCQLGEKLPKDEHDMGVDIIVTEAACHFCA